jgi:tRNA pseudouridine55 synthase
MHGLLIVDKPTGLTSADVVRVVKQRWRCKTGHLGTLDPFASGVLPVCLGEGTKIAQFLNAADKEYEGVIRLGSETDTGDPTGRVTATSPVPVLRSDQLSTTAAQFHGEREQTPPMYSAIKRGGTPLYKLARQGVAVERAARRIRIDALHLGSVADGAVTFSVSCSKGTYIRVLAQEIAAALGSVGHLESLRRVRFGDFGIAEAISLDDLGGAAARLIGLRDALRHLREIRVDAAALQRARRGYEPVLAALQSGDRDEAAKLVGPDGELVAVIAMEGCARWRFARVFAEETRAAS